MSGLVLIRGIRDWPNKFICIRLYCGNPQFFVKSMLVNSPPGGKRIEEALVILAFVRSSVRSATN